MYCTCGQCLVESESRRKFNRQTETGCTLHPELRDKKKAPPMVLDTARPRCKENTTWLGMRGRNAARKLTAQK